MVIIVVLPSSACVAALSAQAHLDHLRSPTRGETNGKTQCSGEGREAERETDGAEGMSTRTIISGAASCYITNTGGLPAKHIH